MNAFVTGGHGFLGWHLRSRLAAVQGAGSIAFGRNNLSELPSRLVDAGGEPVLFHLAGVNRAATDGEVESGNVELAETLASAIRSAGRPVRVVYANSVQSLQDDPYGRGKARAAEILREAVHEVGGSLADVLLPNLFGEHGRPGYNSFVATFCDLIARGETPQVTGDREIPLLHAQEAAQVLMDAAHGDTDEVVTPAGQPHAISEVLTQLEGFKALYDRGEVPDLSDTFDRDLFNTYRSYVFPQAFPMYANPHTDPRGTLFETLRSHGGTGQVFVSTTVPGATRGEHYHLHKVERFFVVSGEAEIGLRKLFTDEVVTFRLGGDKPAFVDMPTMWVHNIRNIGDSDLVTMFWADQLLDPENPDQYPAMVCAEEKTR